MSWRWRARGLPAGEISTARAWTRPSTCRRSRKRWRPARHRPNRCLRNSSGIGAATSSGCERLAHTSRWGPRGDEENLQMTKATASINDMHVVVDLAGERRAVGVATELARQLDAHPTGATLAFDPTV